MVRMVPTRLNMKFESFRALLFFLVRLNLLSNGTSKLLYELATRSDCRVEQMFHVEGRAHPTWMCNSDSQSYLLVEGVRIIKSLMTAGCIAETYVTQGLFIENAIVGNLTTLSPHRPFTARPNPTAGRVLTDFLFEKRCIAQVAGTI